MGLQGSEKGQEGKSPEKKKILLHFGSIHGQSLKDDIQGKGLEP